MSFCHYHHFFDYNYQFYDHCHYWLSPSMVVGQQNHFFKTLYDAQTCPVAKPMNDVCYLLFAKFAVLYWWSRIIMRFRTHKMLIVVVRMILIPIMNQAIVTSEKFVHNSVHRMWNGAAASNEWTTPCFCLQRGFGVFSTCEQSQIEKNNGQKSCSCRSSVTWVRQLLCFWGIWEDCRFDQKRI